MTKQERLADIREKINIVKADMNKPSRRHFRKPRDILHVLTLLEIKLDPPTI